MRAFPIAPAVCLLLLCGTGVGEEGFRPLTAWRAYNGIELPSGWRVSDSGITQTPGGGDLISIETFRNFELAFDWRVPGGGNSGVMYRVVETAAPPYESGPEYQILDNSGHADGRNPLTSAGSAYGLYAPHSDLTRPTGEWNSGRIIVDASRVEHWVNGTKVLAYEIGSEDWKARVAGSKFAASPQFGSAPEGHISLQDHGSAVEWRDVRIRILPD